jgi:hypothetical protein
MSSRFLRMFLCVAIAAAVGPAATLARAAAYTSGWDPITSNGTALLNVGDSCLTNSGFLYVNGYNDTSNGCTVSLVSATVNLVDPTPPEDSAGMASFTLGANTEGIWGIDVVGGALVGLDTFPIGPGTVGDNSDPALNGSWWIQWWDGVYSATSGSGQGETLTNTVSLENLPCEDASWTPLDCQVVSTATHVTFTQTTPEPGSLGLLLGALGAGWWARRRKDAA